MMLQQNQTMRFSIIAKVLAKRMQKYCRVSCWTTSYTVRNSFELLSKRTLDLDGCDLHGCSAKRVERGGAVGAGRAGQPSDIAKAVRFLCDNEQAAFICGQQLMVDGGVSAKLIFPD